MTQRGIGDTLNTALTGQVVRPFFAVKFEFEGGNALFWSGVGDKVINSETYLGAGDIIAFSPQTETAELEANGVNITINGIDSSNISVALTDNYQGRFVTILLGVLGEDQSVTATYILFKGLMDTMTISDDGNYSNISIQCENILIGMNRNKVRRYTPYDHEAIVAARGESIDKGFRFVPNLQDKSIRWGR